MARPADFDLAAALARPNFTPGQRDAPALVELIVAGAEPTATRAAPALAGLGAAARAAILAHLPARPDDHRPDDHRPDDHRPDDHRPDDHRSDDHRPDKPRLDAHRPDKLHLDDGATARLVAVLGLLARAGDREARGHLIATTRDDSTRVRRAAIVALGKLGAIGTARREAGAETSPALELRAGGERRAARRRDRDAAVAVELRDGDTRRIAERRRDEHQLDDRAPRATDDHAPRATDDRAPRATDDRAPRATDDGAPRTTDDGAPRATDDGAPRATDDHAPRTTANDHALRLARDGRTPRPPIDDRAHGEGDDLDDVRAALIARWDATDAPPDERRALAEAMGKIGGEAVLARLGAIDAGQDKELARRRDRAVLMASRSAQRDEESTIAGDVAPPSPLAVRLRCRPGLGELLHAELRSLGLAGAGGQSRDDFVDVRLAGPWEQLFASRLWATAVIRVPLVGRRELADAIVETLTTGVVAELFARWTRGPIRWRLGMRHGTRRSLIWRVANAVTARAPQLINDPTRTTWDVAVDEHEAVVEITPRRLVDPRFAYRVADVPAASHPSVAAAIVWLAEVRAGDRVWDPFCGSGVELIERARRGAARALLGSDVDDGALDAARRNLAAAGVTAELARADARTHAPGPVDVIVTNPPLGSRVHVDAAALLGAALPNFARQLAPGGHLVWISPAPAKTSAIAEANGLHLARAFWVDLGGVRGRLERWEKRASAR